MRKAVYAMFTVAIKDLNVDWSNFNSSLGKCAI